MNESPDGRFTCLELPCDAPGKEARFGVSAINCASLTARAPASSE